MAKDKTIEEIIKELVFREVHNHEVDTNRSVHPAELQGTREVLKEHGKLFMGDGTCICESTEQPQVGEFTKEIRDYIADFIYAEQHGVAMQHKTRCLEHDLIEACDRLDTSEASRKDLLEACKRMLGAMCCDELNNGRVFDDDLRKEVKNKATAAIAKAKQ